jgi:alpha-beta hydrolase superfamily lysophospholipase
MYTNRFTYAGKDGTDIVAYRWTPNGTAIGAVQLTHGMGEHVLRYDELAQALNVEGYVVYGQDHRGHGATAHSEADLGNLGAAGWPGLVDDIGILVSIVRAEQPGLPVVLLAHSMGSFAAQQYLLDNSHRVDAVVLTGTAAIDLLEPALDLSQELDLTMFNAPFQPARTAFDWLTRDATIVDAYIADPRCGFGIDLDSTKSMFVSARRLADRTEISSMRSDLPIYLAVGTDDPVNGRLTLVNALVDRYRAAGLTDVTLQTYQEGRHEILNETNRTDVIADLVTWLRRTHPDGPGNARQ